MLISSLILIGTFIITLIAVAVFTKEEKTNINSDKIIDELNDKYNFDEELKKLNERINRLK